VVEVRPEHWPIAKVAAKALIHECTRDGRVANGALLAAMATLVVVTAQVLQDTPENALVAIRDLIQAAGLGPEARQCQN